MFTSKVELEKINGRISSLAASARSALDETRDHIDKLKAERARLSSLPDDPVTVRARVASAIESAAADAASFFAPAGLSHNLHLHIGAVFNRKFSFNPFGALAAIAPKQLEDLLMSGVSDAGMQSSARAARLADFDRDILAAEIAEELQCRELDEISNGHAPRRLDANPAILLAPDSELQS